MRLGVLPVRTYDSSHCRVIRGETIPTEAFAEGSAPGGCFT